MRFKAFGLVLSLIALVLTTQPSVAYAQEEKTGPSSCTLSYVDVFCAKNPARCRASQVLASTSQHAEFSAVKPSYSLPVFTEYTAAPLSGQGADPNKLFDLVNAYRASVGLPAFEKHPDLCALAASRKGELEGEIANGDIHGGMRRRAMPYWVTENMKYGTSEEEMLSWWLNSPIHAQAIHGNTKYACTECSGPVCIMLFSDFVSKGGSAAIVPTAVPTVTPLVLPSTVPETLPASL